MPRPAAPPDPRITRRIIDAATEVMAESGASAPMREIAKAAGVSYGLLYKHFPNQEALLAAATERQIERVEGWWRAAQEISDPVERIVALCTAPLQPLREIGGFRSTLAFGLQQLPPEALARYQQSSVLIQSLLRRAIREAKRHGSFAGLPEDVLVLSLVGIPWAYLSEALVPEEPAWEKTIRDIGRLIRGIAEATAGTASQARAG